MTTLLKITRGTKVGSFVTLTNDEFTIGSGHNNDLVLNINDVAVLHCRMIRVRDDYDIEDLGSAHGTFVNGQRVLKSRILRTGDIIELGGQVTIEYQRLTRTDEGEPKFLVAGDPGSQPCLVQLEDDGTIIQAYLLQSDEIRIGRGIQNNEIVIPQNDLSRRHSRLLWNENNFWIEDLQSQNGTFVNGERIQEWVCLHYMDEVELGNSTRLKYVYRRNLPVEWDPVVPNKQLIAKGVPDQPLTGKFHAKSHGGEWIRDTAQELEAGELEGHILVVYGREDWEDVVVPLIVKLQDARQSVWADQHLRPDSPQWKAATAQAQLECKVLILIVSPAAMQSDYVRKQFLYFLNRDKPIIIIDYKPTPNMGISVPRQLPRIPYDADAPGNTFTQLLYLLMNVKR